MKKLLLLLLPLVLTIGMMACDFTAEEDLSRSSESSYVANESSEFEVSTESSYEIENSQNFESSENSNTSFESNGENNVPVEKTIEGINVTIEGKDSLANNGYVVSSNFEMTVSVTVKGEAATISALDASSITASVDVSGVNEIGEVELLIEYSFPSNVEMISSSSNFANIEIERKSSNDISEPDNEDEPDNSVDEVRIVNGVLIAGTRAMEQFGGSASGGENTAAMLNQFKQTMGDSVNVYVLPAPLASAFYAPEGYERSVTRHEECFYGLRDALKNVGFVDSLSALNGHTNESIYFRTDHHWQALAAYYCCEELAKVAGVPFDDISTFVKKSEEGILGSFYTSYTQDEVLKNNPDTMIWYEPTREHTVEYYTRDNYSSPVTGRTLFSTNSGYTKFIYGDSYTTHIKTNVGNGRKILVFKDSYGNALAPFLVGSFDEIFVADYRYFELDVSDFIAEHGITDVCFSLAAFKVNNCNAVTIKY